MGTKCAKVPKRIDFTYQQKATAGADGCVSQLAELSPASAKRKEKATSAYFFLKGTSLPLPFNLKTKRDGTCGSL